MNNIHTNQGNGYPRAQFDVRTRAGRLNAAFGCGWLGSKMQPSVWMLAASATVISICMSALAGWERGASLPERLVLVAGSVFMVLSAHLMPTLFRTAAPVCVAWRPSYGL
ncbi:hypothetical protein P3T20_004077 [Paraburkholderia sp. GAS206C]